ncbi:sugar transferase [Mesorhizobium sp. BAC0120]|uniref:sugar transferase n=1 Tax=Mesorhizobium sp. BAC0120 TaxID=3090670 RepID=UPI00298C5579|nr:sugar transferase [Mesorhizobium sp. BAC0120]MDW6023077.1 sugar transferase [Mesorhizobium sp. BAC0120]
MSVRLFDRVGGREIAGLPTFHYVEVKRIFDILFVVLVAPATILLLAICALAILVSMGRPILFRQERVGKGGRVFNMCKLRTMETRHGSGVVATVRDDPRITPLGHWLRLAHFDELPQLWNILKGDMSLIGPRPEQPALVEAYRMALPEYDLRHSVVPGLTGWAQVYYGYAADLDETRQKLIFDLYYVRNISFRLDLKIFLRTFMIYANSKYVR